MSRGIRSRGQSTVAVGRRLRGSAMQGTGKSDSKTTSLKLEMLVRDQPRRRWRRRWGAQIVKHDIKVRSSPNFTKRFGALYNSTNICLPRLRVPRRRVVHRRRLHRRQPTHPFSQPLRPRHPPVLGRVYRSQGEPYVAPVVQLHGHFERILFCSHN